MKSTFHLLAVVAMGLLLNGCGNIDIKPAGDVNRVVTGTVNYQADEGLPPDAMLTVRLINNADPSAPAAVIGEQTITNPGASPVAFRIEYRADDVLLQHGLNLEARISVGGRLRFYNVTNYAVTFTNASDPHALWVNRSGK